MTGVPDGYNIFFPSLLDLASAVDVLIVAAAGGPGTRHLINRSVLEALGRRGYLINIARGNVVDQEALVQLLVARAIGGPGSTFSLTNHRYLRHCWRWTTSCSHHTWPAEPSKPALPCPTFSGKRPQLFEQR